MLQVPILFSDPAYSYLITSTKHALATSFIPDTYSLKSTFNFIQDSLSTAKTSVQNSDTLTTNKSKN